MTDNMMVCAVVVMYNTYCQESPTCMALKKTEKIRVIIYDNSTRDMGNREYCESLNWVYLGGDGNKGISKAYNACIDYIKEKGIKGIICLFDDDTAVEPAYFESL
ncbi:MAG: glycosyltransferase, partial [Clostridia bacterium]|nr:glycosyltransferase [Clostridia bacterium]